MTGCNPSLEVAAWKSACKSACKSAGKLGDRERIQDFSLTFFCRQITCLDLPLANEKKINWTRSWSRQTDQLTRWNIPVQSVRSSGSKFWNPKRHTHDPATDSVLQKSTPTVTARCDSAIGFFWFFEVPIFWGSNFEVPILKFRVDEIISFFHFSERSSRRSCSQIDWTTLFGSIESILLVGKSDLWLK